MATENEIRSLSNRSDASGSLPTPPMELEPLPKEIVKAFPAMAEWHKRNNEKLAEWVKKTNTALKTY